MTKISAHNQSLLFLLIFTIISSVLAYRIITKAYDNLLVDSTLRFELAH
ncbi:hypothetical protein HYW73_00885 [Candidatus Nomurabacteria bacterium]|nr:hypothetical protein [Candidatus Nomurabacteria bacterium]